MAILCTVNRMLAIVRNGPKTGKNEVNVVLTGSSALQPGRQAPLRFRPHFATISSKPSRKLIARGLEGRGGFGGGREAN